MINMKLRDLEKVLRGSELLTIEWRDKDGYILSLWRFISEIKDLNNAFLDGEVLRVDFDTKTIFIKLNKTAEGK